MKLNSFFRFGIVGTFGFCVDVGTLYTLLFLGVDYFFGRLISFLLAVIFTWQCNRRFTFDACSPLTLWQEAFRYLLASSLGGAVNIAIYTLLVSTLAPSPITPLLGVALGSIMGLLVNYFASKKFVFQSNMHRKP